MNKPTMQRIYMILILLFLGLQSIAQNFVPFTPRFNQDLKGDIILIGNNILGPDNNAFNDNSAFNNNVDMQYIDIDGDASTFSSSSADLNIPNPNCYDIKYAGIYWGAVTPGSAPITNVKFKGPTGGYNDISGTVIFNAGTTSVDGGNSFPYACYADVTSIVTSLGNNLGTYTMANVSSAVGETETFTPRNGTGYSAGWSLVVVYEDPSLPGKSITSFDGFSSLIAASNPTVDISLSGFRTVPAPSPVRANFSFAALEGDKRITGDRLRLNGTTLSAADRGAGNFFNSSVTQLNATPVTNRNPNSTNTLGFDTGILSVPNPGNIVIANNATTATVRLETSQDTYFPYYFSFAVEIIEPDIVLTKIVEDNLGNDVGGQTVALGQELNYVIGFQNTGNDDATNFTIRDILPINIVFDYPAGLTLPPGVTVASYNPTTREIVFNVADYLVEENDPVYEIRIETNVVVSCSLLVDVCSNIINNQAFATYQGSTNPAFTISDDPSYSANTGCLITPQATNFLADLNDCVFVQNETLCGDTLQLTAANGYSSYSWSTSPSGTPVIGTTQTITVTATGTYYSFNTAAAPCQSITQEYNVTRYGGNIQNPIIPFADEVVTCPNDGKQLPNIFLCGINDFRELTANVDGAASIIWEMLDESSCPAVANDDCANENSACTWNQVATGPSYTANTSGQFRLTINYDGGCFNQFYFNVYQNLLEPTVAVKDIICTTPGSITVNDVPSGYEYSLDGTNYQASNIFSITAPGLYTVYVRQTGVPAGACVFRVPDIRVRQRNFDVSTKIDQPLCNGDKGTIYLAANDVEPQYYFELYSGGTLINSVGPINENNYAFENLNPGTYTATVETDDGCFDTQDITIVEPALLEATSAITAPLTCTDGEITVSPVGGTAPYFYFVNSTTVFQTDPEIVVTAPGTYDITVFDSNDCRTTTKITIDATPAPEFTVSKTDVLCANDGDSGTITINVTNANGNTLEYSIDGGTTYSSSNVFTGLATGSYDVVVQYTNGPSVCSSVPQTIMIDANTAISGTAVLTTPYTCTSNGTVTITNTAGGTAPYMYSIDGGNFQASNVFSNLTQGTYTFVIRDANNCTFNTNEIIIAPLDPPTDLMFSNTALTCPTNTVDVTITGTTGGVAPLEYQITAPAGQATPYQTSTVFTGLAPGIYTFQVRDANNCTYSESYAIQQLPVIAIASQTLNDVRCFGGADGSVRFNVTGTTSFEYSINGSAPVTGTSPIILTGLSAGTYTITVTDTNTNCTATATATVNEPSAALTISLQVSQITCVNDGSVVITPSGGTAGYTYTLTLPDATVLPSQTTNTFNNLSQGGTYTISVTDTSGCTVTDTFDLTIPNAPVANISATSDFCYDATNGATLVVDVVSGQAPYQFSINGGPFQSSNTFSNLVPGTYTITVRDALGCEVTLAAEIIAQQLSVNTVLTKGLDCAASPDAVITGTINGGYSPFTYSVSINGGGYTSLGTTGSPFTYTTNTAGTYQFQVTDTQGCTATSIVNTVDPLVPVTTANTSVNPTCNGDTNGSITLNATAGAAPFTYSIDGGATFVPSNVFGGLSAGTYSYVVRDSKQCEDSGTITLTGPDPISANIVPNPIQCNTNVPGSLDVTITSGGVAPFTYSLYDNTNTQVGTSVTTASTTHTFSGLSFGDYYVTIVDANGCDYRSTVQRIETPPNIQLDSNTTTGSCATGVDVTISVITGAAPFTYSIFGQPSTAFGPTAATSYTFTGLEHGTTYFFQVQDAGNCFSVIEVTTPTISAIDISALTTTDVSCKGADNGAINFTVSNYNSPSVTELYYEVRDQLTNLPIAPPVNGTFTGLTGAPVSGTITGLAAGNYTLFVRENDGTLCSVSRTFQITEPVQALTASVTGNVNANCNTGAQVTVTATGGTAPYQYAYAPSPTAPTVFSANNVLNLDPAIALNWNIIVRDANGCVFPLSVTIASDPSPVVTATVTNQCTALEGQFEIDVDVTSPGIAPYSFSIDGGAFQTRSIPFTITNLSSGTHTIAVRDANGCGNQVSVTILAPLGTTPEVTALPSCSNDDGEITVTAAGGSGPGNYTYSIAPMAPTITLSGNVFSGVPSGTYTVTVTDAITSCTKDVIVTLGSATPVTFTTTSTDVACNGDSDGTITVQLPPSNDNPIYTYEIIAPITVGPQNSNLFTGLPAGTYTVQVNSGRGCAATQTAVVNEPTVLVATASAGTFSCDANNNPSTVTITINGNGGTTAYSYSINGTNYFSSNTFEISDTGTIQNITAYVKDANSCIATDIVTIDPLPTITAATVVESSPFDCNQTGSVTINVTGGSGNFTFQMLPNGAPQPSSVFAITVPGTYYFQVNDLDTSCYFLTQPFTVAPYDTIDAVLTTTQNNNCFGDTDGALELTLSGYTGAYTYQLYDSTGAPFGGTVTANTATNPEIITGLPGGNYYVDIVETDTPFCSTSSNVVRVNTPPSAVTLNLSQTSNVTCDNNKGTITAIASGGTAPYQYELTGSATVPYSSNGSFTDLAAGTYTVNVRDANGCMDTGTITLTLPTPIDATFTASTTLLSCFGDQNASITVTNVTGGQMGNYSYTLNTTAPTAATSGPQGSNVFNDLGVGTYTVTVSDGFNCTFTSLPITISQPQRVNPSLVVNTTATCLNDASVTLSAVGGTGTYEYSNSPNFTPILGSFTSSVTFTVPAGTYRYYVRDANGCTGTVSNDITIEPVPALIVNLKTNNPQINCTGDTNGVIEATAQGGLGNYVYTLQDTMGNTISATQASPGIFSGLPAGTYVVYVESGDCAATSETINITEPQNALVVDFDITDVTCFGDRNGMVVFSATGGTGIIKYAISPNLDQFFTTGTFEDLAAGAYTVIVQDALGCYQEIDFTIAEPQPVIINVIAGSVVPELCTGDQDGSFSIEIQGGTAPYSVSLDDYNGTYTTGAPNQTDFSFTDLGGGSHTVYVRDSQGCESEIVVDFPESVLIDPKVDVAYVCQDNFTTNIVTVTVDGSITDLSQLEYSLNNGPYQASNIFTDLPPSTNNFITVRHTNGCSQMTAFFDIETFEPLSLILSNGGLNEIVATASGGTGGYTYTFNDVENGTDNTYIITRSGTYTVTVTDSSGCTATATITLEFIDICIPNYFTPNQDGVTDSWAPGCADNYPDITTQVFDRYGREVAKFRAGGFWDGRYNNKELPTGDYWYVVKLSKNNDREFVGHFTLYR